MGGRCYQGELDLEVENQPRQLTMYDSGLVTDGWEIIE